jgi:hypothetical protein
MVTPSMGRLRMFEYTAEPANRGNRGSEASTVVAKCFLG